MEAPTSAVLHPTSVEEFKTIRSENELMAVKYSAVWCGPCRAIAPLFEQLAQDYKPRICFVHVDVDLLSDLEEAAKVRGVPTFQFYAHGELLAEFSGANQIKLKEHVQELAHQSDAKAVVHVDSAEAYEDYKYLSPLLVVKFSAQWCGPCRAIAPQVEAYAQALPQVRFLHIDVEEIDSHPDIDSVQSLPTFRFYRQGNLVYEFSGANASRLEGGLEILLGNS